ncbi:MAG: hypothetical protein IAI50_05070 [Candidatus Eremiobacteraeota bacterium]|nr:hypothetical protein [Candidatus Eremiobacteraeota bacterium]
MVERQLRALGTVVRQHPGDLERQRGAERQHRCVDALEVGVSRRDDAANDLFGEIGTAFVRTFVRAQKAPDYRIL